MAHQPTPTPEITTPFDFLGDSPLLKVSALLLLLWGFSIVIRGRNQHVPAPEKPSTAKSSTAPRTSPSTKMTFTPPGQNSTRGNLGPEGTESFTPAQLAQFDGKDESKPVYIAIRGVVFDCTTGRSMYGPGGSYGIFAGKDASRALAKSSLKAEDVVADIQGLTEKEVETLEQWETFYRKKYPVVGRLVQ